MSRLQEPIAVVSMGALFPGRGTTHGFWRDIVEGVDALGPVPPTHWLTEDYYDPDPRKADRTYGARGGFLKPVAFEPMAFGMPPNAIPATDTVQLLALIVAKAVLEEAEAASGGRVDRARTSVILGVASATELVGHMSGRLQRPVWENALRAEGLPEARVQEIVARMEAHYTGWSEATFPGMLGNVVAGRIANRLDLGGSNLVTDAACASSLAALSMAIQELTLGDSDTVLVGGVDALNDILMYMCFSKTPALSPTGDCRPFSETSDGTMLGEGVGILALRRLADAERDGQPVHAVLRGLGGGSDGRATAIYAPLPEGQARALRRAYERAGYDPHTVELMEAHGTGTKAGDAAEIAGLKRVFDPEGRAGEGGAWCALGSVKSQIGHTKAAAGAASLIKAVMALENRVLPPTAKVEAPAKALAGSPFRVSTTARPWVRGGDHPRRASVSSFGFGGSNFHVTLEEYTGANRPERVRAHKAELMLVCGRDGAELARALEGLRDGLRIEGDLARAASASHGRFRAGAGARAALVARDEGDAREAVERALKALAGLPPSGAVSLPGLHLSLAPARAGKVAFLFPGQGSQAVGMGAELAMAFPQALAAWDFAASHALTGPMRLHEKAFPATAFTDGERAAQEKALTALEVAQPALAAASLAVLGVLDRLGLKAEGAAGHSFGEVMALHVAGVIDASAALGIAHARAHAMAQAAAGAPGAMLAVQAGAGLLAERLKGSSIGVANDNASTQCVLSGPVDAIAALERQLAGEGLKVKRLPVASAFHSPIVAGAVEPFASALEGVAMARPAIPVWSNALARPYPPAASAIRKTLARQIAEPVRFREMLEGMVAAGFDTFVEVGPGQVVSALVRQVAGERAVALALDGKAGGLSGFLSGVGALCVAGHGLDVARLYEGQPAPPEPVAPSRHAVMICGANYGRPYPPAGGAAGRHAPNPEPASKPVPIAAPAMPAPEPVFLSPQNETDPMTHPASMNDTAALAQLHADLAQRHSEFLQIMSAAHQHYVSTVAGMVQGQGGVVAPMIASAPAPVLTPVAVRAEPEPKPQPQPQPARVAETVVMKAASAPIIVAPAAAAPVAAPKAAPVQVASTPARAVVAAPVAQPVVAKPAGGGKAQALVTAIVAEKTGYPEDMLDPDMDLEAELGVDSIKQVEILSTLRERMPELPEIAPERLGELRSIGAIAAFLGGGAGAQPVTPAAPVKAVAPAPAPVAKPGHGNGNGAGNGHAKGGQREAMTALVRALIAEKTGYPQDMLEDDMDLESELGVDSIKQVEILSALREQRPDLPDVEPGQMAELRSIGKIAGFFA